MSPEIDRRLRPVDLLVHLPVGMVLSAHRVVPELVAVGREQTRRARQLGVMVVSFGRLRLAQDRRGGAAGGTPRHERSQTSSAPAIAAHMHAPASTGTPAAAAPRAGPAAERPPARNRTATRRRPDLGTLPIDGFDLLPAADIVPLLRSLGPAERRAIAVYEAAHRGRRTILARLAQLENDPNGVANTGIS